MANEKILRVFSPLLFQTNVLELGYLPTTDPEAVDHIITARRVFRSRPVVKRDTVLMDRRVFKIVLVKIHAKHPKN